uniref:Capsid protein n=1 Tax=Oat dwarf virus TaxID=497863 RepID=A0A1L4AAV3_9GEMI|nr:capsid protein [Oat dwarf virus]
MTDQKSKGKRKRDDGESSGRWKGAVYKRRKTQYKVVPVRPPALCVFRQQWITPDKQSVVVNNTPRIDLITCFAAGKGDDNRHTNQTIMYKFHLQGSVYVADASSKFVTPLRLYHWLVYDAEPKQAMPGIEDIFTMPWNVLPSTWTIWRAWAHRFVVKRKWHVDLVSDGKKVGSSTADTRYNYVVGKNIVDCNKFIKGLRVSTEWMNTGDGKIGDIKKGALYLVTCTRAGVTGDSASTGFNVVCNLTHACYFKSIGLQ